MTTNTVEELAWALAVTVLAIAFIYRICERMVEAMQELDDRDEDDDVG